MNKLIDKLTLFLLCLACFLQYEQGAYIIVPVLIAAALGAALSFFDKGSVSMAVFLLYCGACVAYSPLFFFLPLLAYDVIQTKWRWLGFSAVIPLVSAFEKLPVTACLLIMLFIALSVVTQLRTASLEKLRGDYIALRDTTKEFSMQLENKNKELMEKQDYEVRLATLNERNRIAREIHDNIGHMLTNSILQTGALMAVNRDEKLGGMLDTLKGTLTDGMDSIRKSIHDLHDESVDLYSEAKALAGGFTFCGITLDYSVESNPDSKIKYAMLAIIKEALSNVVRHTNATSVHIALREHPALYQLVVKDNGTKAGADTGGIGLKNIEQRVQALGGIVTISREGGFTVFASIPKEKA